MDNSIEKRIVQKVIDELTGNFDKDLDMLLESRVFLLGMSEEPQEGDIQLRNATFDLLLPEEEIEDLGEVMERLDSTMMKYYKMEQNDKALILAMDLLTVLDDVATKENTASEVYYSFEEPFEVDLYTELNGVKKKLMVPPACFSTLYSHCAMIMLVNGILKGADDCYSYARRWNPISAHIALDYVVLLRLMKDYEAADRVLQEISKVVYKEKDISNLYMLLGDSLSDKECLEAANVAYLKSLEHAVDDVPIAARLYYLMREAGELIPDPSEKDEDWYCKRFHIPKDYDESVIDLLYKKGGEAMAKSDLERAYYYYDILADMVEDEDVYATYASLQDALDMEGEMLFE